MQFEGVPGLFRHLHIKREYLASGDARHTAIRPVLIVLSGVMRGVYGGGQIRQLVESGLLSAFDAITCVSTGAPAAAYGLAGNPQVGLSIYWQECCTTEFFSPMRQLTGGVVMDIEYLCRVFRGEVPGKTLDQEAVRRARPDLYVAVTRCDNGEGALLNAKRVQPDMVEAIRASMALPGISNGRVTIDGVEYIDGAGAVPFPVRHVLRELDPTDILVLANRPEGDHSHFLEQFLERLIMYGLCDEVVNAFMHRNELFLEELERLRAWNGRWGIIWSDDKIKSNEMDPRVLQQGAERSYAHLRTLLKQTIR